MQQNVMEKEDWSINELKTLKNRGNEEEHRLC